MRITPRREFFQKLLAIPLIFYPFRRAFADDHLSKEKWQHQYLAIRILRLLNTLEHWYSLENRYFLALAELPDSLASAELTRNKRAEDAGIGKSLYQQLQLGEEEIVKGWKLQFALAEDGLGYLATITDTSELNVAGFSTSEKGVILRNERLGEATKDPPSESRIRRFFEGVAGVVRPTACVFCWEEFPCRCGLCCSCQQMGGELCLNCGCPQCVWCCCLW